LIKEEFKDEIARESAIAAKIAAEKAAKIAAEKAAEKAKKETTERNMKDIALKLLADNKYSPEDICRLTGLSIDEVLDLRKQLN
ncbi:MAG: hypothetical protein ACI32F_02010, partial [Allobaculum sp.]